MFNPGTIHNECSINDTVDVVDIHFPSNSPALTAFTLVKLTPQAPMSWRRQWQATPVPLPRKSQYPCLENPMDGGAWWAAVHGVAKSRT